MYALYPHSLSISNQPLIIILLIGVVDNVEESELVDTLGGRDNTEPIPQLLLLEELLCPVPTMSVIILISPSRCRCTHRYLRYRPENWVCAVTSIFPSPRFLINTTSPRFPTRLSTLILSWRNFSNAETSKILSLAGCEALMMNFSPRQPHCSCKQPLLKHNDEEEFEERRLEYLPCWWPWPACPWWISTNRWS